MDKKTVVSYLEDLLRKFTVKVVYEKDCPTDGLCTVYGQKYLYMKKNLDVNKKINVMSGVIKKLPVDSMYILPKIRDLILD